MFWCYFRIVSQTSLNGNIDQATTTAVEMVSINLVSTSAKLVESRKTIISLTLDTVMEAFHVRKPKNSFKLEKKNLLMCAFYSYSISYYHMANNGKVWKTYHLFPELILASMEEEERDFESEVTNCICRPPSQDYLLRQNELIEQRNQLLELQTADRQTQKAVNAANAAEKDRRKEMSAKVMKEKNAQIAAITDPEEIRVIEDARRKAKQAAKRCFDESAGADDGDNGDDSEDSDLGDDHPKFSAKTTSSSSTGRGTFAASCRSSSSSLLSSRSLSTSAAKVNQHKEDSVEQTNKTKKVKKKDKHKNDCDNSVHSPKSPSSLPSSAGSKHKKKIKSLASSLNSSFAYIEPYNSPCNGVVQQVDEEHPVTPADCLNTSVSSNTTNETTCSSVKVSSNASSGGKKKSTEFEGIFSGVAHDDSLLHEADMGSDPDSDLDDELDFDNPGVLFQSARKGEKNMGADWVSQRGRKRGSKKGDSSSKKRRYVTPEKMEERRVAQKLIDDSKALKIETAKKKREESKEERRQELANITIDIVAADGTTRKKRFSSAISSEIVQNYVNDFDLNRVAAKSNASIVTDAIVHVLGRSASEENQCGSGSSSRISLPDSANSLSKEEKIAMLDKTFKEGLMMYCQMELFKDVMFERLVVNYCIAKREITGTYSRTPLIYFL